jgi:hypothetical protein
MSTAEETMDVGKLMIEKNAESLTPEIVDST